MSIEALKAALPDYAKDLKLNLGSLVTGTSLDQQQLWGTFLATAIASRSEQVLAAIDQEATTFLKPEARDAAKAAAAIMAMNNVYYRFTHLVGSEHYSTMPAKLRMNVIGNPGVETVDFELWSLAVSAINGCGKCLESHEQTLIKKGASREMVQDAVRVASVVHAVAVTLDAEDHFYAAESAG